MYRSKGTPTLFPHRRGSKVERPRFPQAGLFPFSAYAEQGRSLLTMSQRGAAFFDLDRTLLAGASRRGVLRRDALRRAGVTIDPRRAAPVPAVQHDRRDAAVDGAGPPGGDACQGPPAGGGAGRRRVGGRAARIDGAAVRRVAVRRASRGRPADRAGHHHAVRPGQAVRRSARARRRRRHALRRQRRRHLRRHARGPVRVERRASSPPSASGRTSTTSTSPRATPTATACTTRRCWRRSVTRSSSTPTRAWSLMAAARRWPVLNLDVSPGVMKIPVVGLELQRLAMQLHPSVVLPVRQVRHRGRREHPGRGSGDPGRQPPQLLRLARDLDDDRQDAIARFASSARRRCSTRRSSASSRRRWAASGSIAAPGRTNRCKAAADALLGGEMVAIMPQGTIPRGTAFFDPVLKGRWGAARLAQMTGAPVIPVGLWGTEKVWPRSSRLPNVLNVTDPPLVHDQRGGAGRVEAPIARRRHEADHGRHPAPVAVGGRACPQADGGGTASDVSAGVQR